MKILYTYFGLMQRIGGVSRYFYENITRIEKLCKVNICTLFLSNEYFKERVNRIWFNPSNQKLIYLRIIIEDCFLWLSLKFSKYDLVHLTAERSSVLNWTKKPIVITIHDMIPEIFQTNSKTIQRRKKAIFAASHIICVSENTKNDLLSIYPEIPSNKISVIYHGHSPKKWNYSEQIEGNYLLYVGARAEKYKNFENMAKAIAPILKDNNLKLICTGKKFCSREETLFKELNIFDRVINFGYVSDEMLASLYHFAQCFIYPSSYEGFGIPILEAWEHGCPACISDASCFPEIGGDAAAYFQANNQQSIYNAIVRVYSNHDVRTALIQKGRERLRLFKWDNAAQQTFNVYKQVLKNETYMSPSARQRE